MCEYQESLDELDDKIIALCEEYDEKLPPYEIVGRLMARACCIALACAPTERVGTKTILACVHLGISEYEEQYLYEGHHAI